MLNAIPLVLFWRNPKYVITKKQDTVEPNGNSYLKHKLPEVNHVNVKQTATTLHRAPPTVEVSVSTIQVSVLEDNTKLDHSETETLWRTLCDLLRNKPYIMCSLGLSFGSSTCFTLQIFVQDLILDSGFTRDDASLAITLISVFSIFGRCAPGVLLQTRGFSVPGVLSLSAILMGLGMIGTIMFPSLPLKLICLSIAGIPCGTFVTMYSVMPYKLVCLDRLSTAIGLTMTIVAITTVPSGIISGK